MSHPSTPNNKHDANHPAKTPGAWSRVLGIFSAKKEAPTNSVASSTNDTPVMNGGFSPGASASGAMSAGRDSTANSDIDEFQSPMSHGNGAMDTSFSIGTSPTRGGRKTPSRLHFPAVLSSRKSDVVSTHAPNLRPSFGGDPSLALRNNKSPWKNRAVVTRVPTDEPSVWQSSRSQFNGGATTATAPGTLSFLSNTTTERTRKYRPNSNLLTGSKGGQRFRSQGKLDNAKFGQALADVRDMFLGGQDASTNVFSTKGGMRWGSLERPSRFTQKVQKRQRPAQQMRGADDDDEDDEEGDSRRKRRKKVSFDQEAENDNAFTSSISATPHRNNSGLRRKATPMPTKTSQVSFESPASNQDDGDEERSIPSAQRADRLPSPPPRSDFDFGALDAEGPSTVKLPSFAAAVKVYDAVVPDPEASAHAFHIKLKSKPTASGLVSTNSHAEFEEKRYERPASPVRNRRTRTQDDGDDQTNQRAPKRSKVGESQGTEVIPDWVCTKCETRNNNDETVCQKPGCGNVRTASGTLGWGSLMAGINKGKWKCPGCNSMVDDKNDSCLSCETEKPDEFKSTQPTSMASASNDASSGTANPASGPQFTFQAPPPGSSATPSTGGFTFAAPPASAPGSSTGGFVFKAPQSSSKDETKKAEASSTPSFGFASASAPASSTQTGGFTFGGTSVPAPSFGGNGNLNIGTPKTSLSGDAKPFEPKSVGTNGDKKPAPSSDTTGDNGATSSGFSFTGSTSASTPAQSGTGFQFVSPPATSKTPSDPPASSAPGPSSFSSQFAASSSKESKTAESTSDFSFGSSSGNASATAASGNGGFSGQFASAPTPAPASEQKPKRQRGYDLNGDKPKSSKPPSQAAPTLFGAPAAGSAAAPASGGTFQFGSSSTSKDTENGSGNASASASATHFGDPTGGGMQFGASAGSGDASKPFTFGGTSSSQAPAPSAPGGFGAPSGAPAPTPAFGTAPTSFGTTPVAPSAPAFGGPASATPAPAATSFGTTAAPAATGFGTTAAPAATGFGSAPTPGGSGFGSAPTPGGTGFGTTPAPSSTGFGSAPTPGGPGFGSAPAATGFNAAPAATTFGAAPTPAAGFGFGVGAASTGFGSPTPNPQAATPAAPAFGAQNSGSTGGFGAPGFGGTQTPAAPSQGFSASAFGGNAAPTSGGFGATPGPPGGFGASGFGGAPQTGGFQSTPAAPPGGFGGGFGGTAPNTAPPGGGFNIGSSGPPKTKRRMVRAKRPTSTRKA